MHPESGRPAGPRFASLPYIAPFGIFVVLLGILQLFRIPDLAVQIVLITVTGLSLIVFAGPVAGLRGLGLPGLGLPGLGLPGLGSQSLPAQNLMVSRWASSAGIGILVFAVWIGPDLLFPGYRDSWLFHNAVVGTARSSLSAATRTNPLVLSLRVVRAVLIVPVVEELFWRAWLMRWIIRPDFQSVALGAFSPGAFWIVALLFASEHGPYWDVGLAAGIIYNGWMLKTRSLGDLILAHAVTNFCLSAYVIAAGRWEYWL